MSANTLLTSIVTGGANSHTTTAEEANALPTDFVTQGVVGAITLNTGSAGTGSFCVNADASPDMGVTIKAGQAYVTATPSSQNSQVLRVRASSDYTTYVINANASGSTKYDWIYLSISATNANVPSADGSNVASFVTSRSSSNTTDNGTPPTYGLLLAIVTVANAASSITNGNITDKRFNTSIGAQNGSLIVTQNGTGTDAAEQAAGIDANVNLTLTPKGTGYVKLNYSGAPVQQVSANFSAVATGTTLMSRADVIPTNTQGTEFMTLAITPKSATNILVIQITAFLTTSAAGASDMIVALFQDSTVNALAAIYATPGGTSYGVAYPLVHGMVAGTVASTTFRIRAGGASAGTTTFNGVAGARVFGGITISNITITEYKA